MKLKAIFLSSLVASCLLLGSCGSSIRFLKDGYIFVSTPVLLPMAASSDAYTGARDIREGYQSGAWTEIVAFPVLFVWHGVKHAFCIGAHAADMVFYPFYGIAESSKFGPEIAPIDYYENTWADRWYASTKKKKVDANTGESK